VENSASADDYYEKLGVEWIVNAAGPATALTGALVPAQVQRAVARAALHPVVFNDLQNASGKYIARRLRCEGAIVTSGAAGGANTDRSLYRRRQWHQARQDTRAGRSDEVRSHRSEGTPL
jgi:hypothetical protein